MVAPRLLLIDDDPDIGRFVSTVAANCGYEVRTTQSAAEFRSTYADFDPSVIVLDLAMPEADGVELMQFLASAGSRARVLIMSGFDGEMVGTIERLGAVRGLNMAGSIAKPVRVADLVAILMRLPRSEPAG